MTKKVLVAMSGGVDSSTAAFLLKQRGFEVVGATLKLWHPAEDKRRPGGCCSIDDISDARRVCHFIGIKHYVLNYEKAFKETVVKDFVEEYLAGRTPNPCIVCNEKIKFNMLLAKMRAVGFDCLATGHYARIGRAGGKFILKKGVDAAKDQSYVLYRLGQAELSSLLFPLGDYTKKEIRAIAIENKLPSAEKPESQEICFVDKDYGDFIRNYAGGGRKALKPGPIIDAQGKVLGRHKGIAFYTVGQRSGLNLSLPQAVYVTKIDPANNTLHVAGREGAYSKKALVDSLCWVSGKQPRLPMECLTKIRRLHPEALSVISKAGSKIEVSFKTPQHAVTPGQAAVFYKSGKVIGGGVISS